jgi:hypothetical protein
MASPFAPEYLILHDYGGTPKGDAPFNPYHALVVGGKKIYRDPANPYGAPAPHAFRLNPKSVGLSWGGPVGGTPSPEDLAVLREEVAAIKAKFPNIKIMSHGEAYAATKGTPQQASRDGRGLEEAAWRRFLDGTGPMPTGTETAASGAPPVSARGLTSYAGLTAPPVPAAAPMAPAAAPSNPTDIIASLFGGATPKPEAAANGSQPFGFYLGKPAADDFLKLSAPTPQVEMPQQRPIDMQALLQLAATKRRGGIG